MKMVLQQRDPLLTEAPSVNRGTLRCKFRMVHRKFLVVNLYCEFLIVTFSRIRMKKQAGMFSLGQAADGGRGAQIVNVKARVMSSCFTIIAPFMSSCFAI